MFGRKCSFSHVSSLAEMCGGREQGLISATHSIKPLGVGACEGQKLAGEESGPVLHLTSGVAEHSEIDVSHRGWHFIHQIKLVEHSKPLSNEGDYFLLQLSDLQGLKARGL